MMLVLQALLFFLILSLPVSSHASYKVYLRNGSVISGVNSYEKTNGEVNIIFGGGSVGIPEKDILKIEETETPEKDFRLKEIPGKQEEALPVSPSSAEMVDKSARLNALNAELDSVNSEIGAVEAEESRLVTELNQKRGRKGTYNYFQLKKLEQETDPLQQELFSVQQKKTELIQRKASLENEIKAMQ
jgi:hypothetical protein